MNQTATKKEYVLNLETSKIELHFDKEEYQALTPEEKQLLKRSYLFSGKQKSWVSRSKNNHYSAINTAEKLGFSKGGKVGERLSYTEELEKAAEKAEARAERFEQYSENAASRGEQLQSEFNKLSKDWSWLTQPIIKGHSGSERFGRQKDRVVKRFEKGFDEYRKSDYYKERAERARMTADQTKLKNKTYLNNRIEEVNKRLRQLQGLVVNAENSNNSERVKELVEKMEYEIDKLAFFENCMDELGGVQYNKDNLKKGYLVKIRGHWGEVVKANPKTVQTKSKYCTLELKYPYAEIQDMQIPEDWTEEKKEVVKNPYNVNEIVVAYSIGGDRIIKAFQIVKTTPKTVLIQQIKIEDNKPLQDQFINDEQIRNTPKKDYKNDNVLYYRSWNLYKYNNQA